jgi:hypothetical protein
MVCVPRPSIYLRAQGLCRSRNQAAEKIADCKIHFGEAAETSTRVACALRTKNATLCSAATNIKKAQPRKLSGLGSGDVLLSHDLSSHYHRGCNVSLPCSEWERVVPLRYCHQRDEEFANCDCRFAILHSLTARSAFFVVSGDHVS